MSNYRTKLFRQKTMRGEYKSKEIEIDSQFNEWAKETDNINIIDIKAISSTSMLVFYEEGTKRSKRSKNETAQSDFDVKKFESALRRYAKKVYRKDPNTETGYKPTGFSKEGVADIISKIHDACPHDLCGKCTKGPCWDNCSFFKLKINEILLHDKITLSEEDLENL